MSTTRKFRALTDGPGWRKGDVFIYDPPGDRDEYEFRTAVYYASRLIEDRAQRTLIPIELVTVPYFEEIKPRKIAVYEFDATDKTPPLVLWSENKAVNLVRMEERE